jgi:cell division protein FtsI (penicillin-binding protein 3)
VSRSDRSRARQSRTARSAGDTRKARKALGESKKKSPKAKKAEKSRTELRGSVGPHSARDRRTRQAIKLGSRGASFVFRHRAGNAVIFIALIVAAAQLFYLQVPRAAGLRAEAAGQLKVTDVEKAVRGSIVDRNNDQLAFTIEARALTFQPRPNKRMPKRRIRSSGCTTSPRKLRFG